MAAAGAAAAAATTAAAAATTTTTQLCFKLRYYIHVRHVAYQSQQFLG